MIIRHSISFYYAKTQVLLDIRAKKEISREMNTKSAVKIFDFSTALLELR
ncbi:hypothetical protein HMPREF0621_0358 [Pasteurella dagmatis ATCC 43325]|uniref:Uncharacterized protein n=1 Tax=Pasteurella dagmatis ATCC 43325 TaxID=667128 RepID=C9PMY4_9PAST|nr:hypothetical protein HMPREF0621_0358 [Pasteurella dagmatis ATCC 43325]